MASVPGRDRVIGYPAVTTQEPLFYVGGVLVADEYGLPVEFRHTLPVRPTKLQRALYGAALDRYLRSVVIAQRLVAGIEHDPAVVLVSDVTLAREARIPLGFLEESGVDPSSAGRAPSSRSRARARASCSSCGPGRPRCGSSPRRRCTCTPRSAGRWSGRRDHLPVPADGARPLGSLG